MVFGATLVFSAFCSILLAVHSAYFIMSTLDTTKDLAESLLPLFRMWPAYIVGEGFIQLATAFWER